ncbi:MAG: pseudouridine-5'-phosphate glycosidase [Candidatus Sumerlaeaceae bacterium]|nr:pseudouridine-5'-phosphate glycosidase [Candidatus Sumerlaeaceae bacterium]
MTAPLRLSAEAAAALAAGRPIVALETTILSFGLPQPANGRVAHACERAIREAGAVPATVAALGGEIRVGLDAAELDFFCSRDASIRKVNTQNLAAVLAAGAPGAFTVAASLRACDLAGIRVFATGGIGGVHRGYAETMDISADLTALARHPVVTVCSGAKSILDVAATLEALETLGVPVAGFRTDVFPRFICSQSGHMLDIRVDDAADAARLAATHFAISRAGLVLAVPPPAEVSVPAADLDAWTAEALEGARRAGVRGKALTPFLLERLETLSAGATLRANEALVVNNATVAAHVAVALARP